MQAEKRFTAVAAKAGSRMIIPLPFDPNEAWGEKPRHHVRGTVNERGFRGPLGLDGTGYFLPLGAAWRRDNGVAAGDTVVVLGPEGLQSTELAPDVAEALAAAPAARAFFDGLATFYRKGYIRWIEGARRPATRAARIADMVALLQAGKKQK